MVKHWTVAHQAQPKPTFHLYIVGSYKSCLDRQIAEAVRIHLRGNTLNSVGVYNRCKLTRLVVDTQWDKNVFNDNWKIDKATDDKFKGLEKDGLEVVDVSKDDKKDEVDRGEKRAAPAGHRERKRRKIENRSGMAWGVEVLACEPAREEFLNSNIDMTKLRVKMKQTKVSFKLLKESDVMMKEILWGAVKYAVEVAMNNSVKKELKECELILENAEEWGPEEIQPRVVKKNEEDFLLKMLKELDIKDRKEDAKKARAAKSKAAAEAKLAAKRKNCQKITQFFQMKKKHAEA